MTPIEPTVLMAIGIVLIAVEIFAATFYLFWMGAGFILAAAASYLYPFENGMTQLAIALASGTVLVVLLRKKTAEIALRPQEVQEEKAHVGGVAIIEKGHIKFDGTYWKCNDDLSAFAEGTKVEVTIRDNEAFLVREPEA